MPATPPKAFTLIELVVVIVILGILAAIAVVGYSSVTSRSRQEQVRQAAYAFDLEYRSLLALDGSVNYADITPGRARRDRRRCQHCAVLPRRRGRLSDAAHHPFRPRRHHQQPLRLTGPSSQHRFFDRGLSPAMAARPTLLLQLRREAMNAVRKK